jgi:pimeloyl-ACP methyl ester carboxylesterase
MRRKFARILVRLIGLIALIVVGLLISFAFWRSAYISALETGSRVITTPLGDIEYTVEGQGTPYLYVHGAPGGYDQALPDRHVRPDAFADLKTIAISRPGYLRTPLSSGETPADQADLFAALLDEIGIDRVVVVAVSGGGPAGLQFALRHPERTMGLMLMAPAVRAQPDLRYENPTSASGTFTVDVILWALGRWLGPAMMPGLDKEDPKQVELARLWVKTVIPLRSRTTGSVNDFDMLRTLDVESWPLEQLTVPTLILHGNADRNAPYEGSVAVAARIPNAALVTFDGVGHEVTLTRAREIDKEIQRFIAGL